MLKIRLQSAGVVVSAILLTASAAIPAQLRVEPILLELNAPAASGTLTLHNGDESEAIVQTRVLRWSQIDGRETLEPTEDVVASPPFATLKANADQIVRIVRVAKSAPRGEESYRVIVDQLPNARRAAGQAVNILIRQSIPAFFRARQIEISNVAWTVSAKDGAVSVLATNRGDERLRIAALALRNSSGKTMTFGKGLVGYVLGRSSMRWSFPARAASFGTNGPVSISAETDKGPLHVLSR